MKVDKKELKDCVVELGVQADAAEIADVCKKTLDAFVRNGAIPGFRKGKAPVQVVKQKFADEILLETKQACVNKLMPKAVEEAGLKPLAYTDLEDVLLSPETGVSFKFRVEVDPEVELPKYKKMAVAGKDVPVTDDDVNRSLARTRAMFAKYEDAAEGDAAAAGDFVQIDYAGTVDGRKLSEVVPDNKFAAGSDGFWTQVDAERFFPEIVEALIGMKKGDSKEGVEVKNFPGLPEDFKGKTAAYSVTVKDIRKQRLPDDAELAGIMHEENIEAVRSRFRKDMEEHAAKLDLERRRNECADLLVKGAKFDVPASIVERYSKMMFSDFVNHAQQSRMDSEYLKEHSGEIIADIKARATARVRLDYILDGIATAEGIEVSDDEARAAMEKENAGNGGKQPDAAEKARMLAVLKTAMRREKTLDFVMGGSK